MESHTTTTTTTCNVNPKYFLTPNGILKIVELVLSIIAFACAAAVSDHEGVRGFGWVSFVAISGFIHAAFFMIFHFLISTSWKWSAIIEIIVFKLRYSELSPTENDLIYLCYESSMFGGFSLLFHCVTLEVIIYGIWTIFFLIAGIVAAATCNDAYFVSNRNTGGAAAAFSFFSMVAWAIDTAFQLQHVRITFSSSTTTATTTTTTTATANTANRYEENPQY